MSANKTKQAFSNICDRICTKILSEEKLDFQTEGELYRIVARLAMISWNMCTVSDSLEEAKYKAADFACPLYGDDEKTKTILFSAVSIKWHDYREDNTLIASTGTEIINGKHKSVAYLRGELSPEAHEATNAFRRYMESPEVQERLKNISAEDLNETIGKLVNEYNASLPPVESEEKPPAEFLEYPISLKTLKKIYERTLWTIPADVKMDTMRLTLKEQPFLAPLCKGYEEQFKVTELKRKELKTKKERSSYPGSVPELILAISAAFAPTVDFELIDKELLAECKDITKEIMDSFLRQDGSFRETAEFYEGADLIEFICENVAKLNLPKKEFRSILKALLSWGAAVCAIRESQIFEEEYDFDEKKLKALRLNVELLEEDMSAVMLVREDMTFEELSDYINFMFDREEGHLYRFECDDGCLAVHPEEETDEDDMFFADACYIGHHLSLDDGANYTYDYGEESNFRISVEKVMKAKGDNYPRTIEMTREPPIDEDDDD